VKRRQLKKSPKLFVSFWDICLENLPVGTFKHRQISAAVARRAIAKAREDKSLLCVSNDDLFAPYRKHRRDNHADLRKVLARRLGIKLTLADFTEKLEDDDGSLRFINPLGLVQVQGRDRLLVVTCMYSLDKRKRRTPLGMKVAPSTIEFHLFEAA
jgi:hypothetical protein